LAQAVLAQLHQRDHLLTVSAIPAMPRSSGQGQTGRALKLAMDTHAIETLGAQPTTHAPSVAELSSQWMQWAMMAQEGYRQLQAVAALDVALAHAVCAGQAAMEMEAKASQRSVPLSLRLDEHLPETSDASCPTPSTSAGSTPRGAPLTPPLGMPASPEMSSTRSSSPRDHAGASLLGSAAKAQPDLNPSLHPFRPPPGLPHPPAMQVPTLAYVAEVEAMRSVEWRVHQVHSKLKASAGFALVSPPLQVGEIPEVRLHFAPGEAWTKSMRSRKGKKVEDRPRQGMATGSMNGSLRLKVDDFQNCKVLKFWLFVGTVRQGPLTCNFAERAVQEFQLEVDWRKHVDKSGSLSLRLEVIPQSLHACN